MHWFFKLLIILTVILIPILIIFVFLPKVIPPKVVANKEVAGLIIRDQIWEGTIRVKGDLITAYSTTITLKPGTKVLVAIDKDNSNLNFLPWHLKQGINIAQEFHGTRVGEPFWDEGHKIQLHFNTLIAVGTKEQPITISSDTDSGSPYDFNSIHIRKGIISNASLSNYRRLEVFDQVTIRDSEIHTTGECSICITRGEPSILNNTFRDGLRTSIWIEKSDPKVHDNLFLNSKGYGIIMDPKTVGKATISYNTFEMPGIPLEIISGDEIEGGIVSYNKFSGNTLIVIPCDSKVNLYQNSIFSRISFKKVACIGGITFGPNFWGVTNYNALISEKFIDKEKNFKVFIPTILKLPPPIVGVRN